MSKPWFRQIAMEGEPSHLAGIIAQALQKPVEVSRDEAKLSLKPAEAQARVPSPVPTSHQLI